MQNKWIHDFNVLPLILFLYDFKNLLYRHIEDSTYFERNLIFFQDLCFSRYQSEK